MYGVDWTGREEDRKLFNQVWDEHGWRTMPILDESLVACPIAASGWLRTDLCDGDASSIHRTSLGKLSKSWLSDRSSDQYGLFSRWFQSQSEERNDRKIESVGVCRRFETKLSRHRECRNKTDLHWSWVPRWSVQWSRHLLSCEVPNSVGFRARFSSWWGRTRCNNPMEWEILLTARSPSLFWVKRCFKNNKKKSQLSVQWPFPFVAEYRCVFKRISSLSGVPRSTAE